MLSENLNELNSLFDFDIFGWWPSLKQSSRIICTKEGFTIDFLFRNYMNDSLRTTVFACYHPETIACACIYLAAIHLQFPLGTNWFEIFNVSEDTIQAICLSILNLYSLNKPDLGELEKKVAHLRKAQIEARNQKIALEKKEQQDMTALTTNSVESKSKKSDRDTQDKRELDTKGKENLEKNASHRKKAHKSRKSPSPSPRYDRRYRSRSSKKGREHSQEKRKNHKKYSDKKEYVDKKHRKSYDSDEEYNSDKRRRPHIEYNGSKEYFKQKPASPNSSSSERRYNNKKRQRSSSPSNDTGSRNYLHKAPVSSSSKHSSRHIQNGTKMYR